MTVLCSIHELEEGQSRGFLSHKGPVFAVKRDAQIFVYKNECPHLGVNLEFQPDEFLDSEGALIQCSMHGALFTIDEGLCVSGPCQGDHLEAVSFDVIGDQITLSK